MNNQNSIPSLCFLEDPYHVYQNKPENCQHEFHLVDIKFACVQGTVHDVMRCAKCGEREYGYTELVKLTDESVKYLKSRINQKREKIA